MTSFRQLIRYKDIVFYRTHAGIKSEARQNYLGYIWFLAEPVMSTAVLYFAWAHINGSQGFDAILTILIGMVAWGWFESSVMGAGGSIKAKFHVLNQFALPKWIFPVVTILVNSWKSMFVFLVVLGMAAFKGLVTVHLLWLPVIMAVQMLLIVGVALPISIAITLVNDLSTVVSSMFRLLFFVSGLFFTAAKVHEQCLKNNTPGLYEAFLWNPMAVLIDAYRAVIQRAESPDFALLGRATVIATGMLLVGLALNAYYDKKILKLTNV